MRLTRSRSIQQTATSCMPGPTLVCSRRRTVAFGGGTDRAGEQRPYWADCHRPREPQHPFGRDRWNARLHEHLRLGGIFKSSNGGRTWHEMDRGLMGAVVPAIAIDASTPAVLYAGSADGMFKSTNGGKAWVESNSGLSDWPVGRRCDRPHEQPRDLQRPPSKVLRSASSG